MSEQIMDKLQAVGLDFRRAFLGRAEVPCLIVRPQEKPPLRVER